MGNRPLLTIIHKRNILPILNGDGIGQLNIPTDHNGRGCGFRILCSHRIPKFVKIGNRFPVRPGRHQRGGCRHTLPLVPLCQCTAIGERTVRRFRFSRGLAALPFMAIRQCAVRGMLKFPVTAFRCRVTSGGRFPAGSILCGVLLLRSRVGLAAFPVCGVPLSRIVSRKRSGGGLLYLIARGGNNTGGGVK